MRNKIIAGLSTIGTGLWLIPIASAQLSTSTAETIVNDQISALKDVAGTNLPTIIAVAVLISLVFVAYRWFKKFTGVHR